MARRAGAYQTLWAKLKENGTIKVDIPAAVCSKQLLYRRFHQIRRHISDRKAADIEFRQQFPDARLRVDRKDYVNGSITLSILYATNSLLDMTNKGT